MAGVLGPPLQPREHSLVTLGAVGARGEWKRQTQGRAGAEGVLGTPQRSGL